MKTYKNQKDFEAEIKDGKFYSNESIDITDFNLDIEAHIEVRGDINAGDIKAGDIKAGDINAGDINAGDINAGDINAGDINAGDINAWDIKAGDIKEGDINAWDIKAKKVEYYAVAFAYNNIKVKSIRGIRENSKHFVLDGVLETEE